MVLKKTVVVLKILEGGKSLQGEEKYNETPLSLP